MAPGGMSDAWNSEPLPWRPHAPTAKRRCRERGATTAERRPKPHTRAAPHRDHQPRNGGGTSGPRAAGLGRGLGGTKSRGPETAFLSGVMIIHQTDPDDQPLLRGSAFADRSTDRDIRTRPYVSFFVHSEYEDHRGSRSFGRRP